MPLALCAALLAALLATPLAGQEPRTRGSWIAAGLGPAWADMDCGRCRDLADSIPYAGGPGFAGHLLAGLALSERARLGAGAWLYGRVRGNRSVALVDLRLTAQLHPSARAPVFVRLGPALSVGSLSGGGVLVEASGASLHGELGGELWRLRRWVVAPYLGAMHAWYSPKSASVRADPRLPTDPPHRPRSVYGGVGFTRY